MNIAASFRNNVWNNFNWLLAGLALALAPPTRAATPPAAIPFSDIGARATAGYQGDALGVTAAADGARLRCGFQKLEGHATPEGLWLESTKPGAAGKLRLTVSAICRAGPSTLNFQPSTVLPSTGTVSVQDKLVRFTRPGLTEEYSVSADGLRQDFIIESPPLNPQPSTLNLPAGDLRVGLALSGARAEATASGARLRLEGSGRTLAYSRLRVEDATGRELTARLEVLSADQLAVSVADANATYPVRIDPTFSDADWVSLNPGLPGANGDVSAIAVDGSGNVYVGGSFNLIGTTQATNVAKWDGSVWSALGSGMNNPVYALAVSGTNLYAGGLFTTASGVTVNCIAKWNGSAWSALGSGLGAYGSLPPCVNALAVSGTDLYAGGRFTAAGGASANNIAKWDGNAWSALGSGVDDAVYALTLSGTNLYAAGALRTAGGVSAKNIAKWDGTAWSALGSGMYGICALAVSGSDLYAGGQFTTAGGVPANNIAKWDGSAWSALGSGISGGYIVSALAMSGTVLYAGGSFKTAGGLANIAQWDGSSWSALGSGLDGDVYALAADGVGHLFVGGAFSLAGTKVSPYIAQANLGAQPVILASPASLAAPVGATADFQVVASSSLLPAYQWVFNGTNPIAGATSAVLSLTNVQFAQAGAYSVTVSNLYGTVTSAPAVLTVTGGPVLIASPASLAVLSGTTVDFQVEAIGVPPLVYQWVFNGATAIPGATSSVLILTNIQLAQAGTYSVTVSNLYGAVTGAPALLQVFPRGIVATNSEMALRMAMTGGGAVTFTCDGTITLASTITNVSDTTLDGSGHQVTISGGGTVRIFCVSSNVRFTLMNLTVAQGSSDTMGAGILNCGGTVNAIGVAFTANSVSSSGKNGSGGAIRNERGTLNLQACSFAGNSVIGSGTFTNSGGAIYNNGTMNATACTFTDNQARNVGPSGQEWMAGGGAGGAVYNARVAVLEGSTFSGNTAVGADGWPEYPLPPINGGTGSGGAICNLGRLTIQTSSLLANSAEGGKGGDAPRAFSYAGGPGANGGSGLGGALDNKGTATVASSTFADNSARGGPGSAGADGTYHQLQAAGGRGGAGGWATGAVHNRGSIGLVNCTFASNSAFAGAGGNGGKGGTYLDLSGYIGGSGGAGGPGGSASGCLYGGAGVTNCTVASNSGQSGSGGQGGAGGAGTFGPGPVGAAGPDGTATGGFLNVGGQLVNTLLAWNTPQGGDSFPDPKLGPLADNGGPTLTMALLPGSPAIDAGNTSLAPATDQRGFPRPAGLAADIGAFEYGSVMLGPPQVSTLPATGVSTKSATLNGTVNPVGWSTTAWFQWGATTNYGNLTSMINLGSGTTALPLSAPLAGLTPSVTYHFRVAATNDYGLVYGGDQSFTTSNSSAVMTLPATAVTSSSATLQGTVNPKGWPTTAWFQWGTTTNYANLTSMTNVGSGTNALPLSALAGLSSSITYHFCIAASNGYYGLVYGSDQSFTSASLPVEFTYTLTNGTITITGYTGPGGAVTIRSTINGYPVTSIGDQAFLSCNTLTSLTMPDSVTNLGAVAFGFCPSLTSVTIPNSLITIGHDAFRHCTSLTSVAIPSSVTSIGVTAFGWCSQLRAITVDPLNPVYSGVEGILFNKSQTTLIQYPGGKAGSYTIPNGVTSIGDWAFFECQLVTGPMILNNVTSVGYQAFEYCTSLTSVTVSNGVVGTEAFCGCYNATNVTIGDGVISIGQYGFSCGPGLTSVTIGSGLTGIGYQAFGSDPSLRVITVDARNPLFSSVDGVLFDKSQTTLIQYPGGRAGSYTIPDSVTHISNAFEDCARLTTVTVPVSTISIADWAFVRCTSLTAVYFRGAAPSLGSAVFDGDANAIVYYLPGTAGWGTTFGGVPTALWIQVPTILTAPQSQTAEAGAAVRLGAKASSPLPLFYVWYLNHTPLVSCGTNSELDLTNVQFSQSGAYTVVVSNVLGAVTTSPAMLNVIAAVERRPVPGVKVIGQTGSLLNVDYANSLSPAPNWTSLGSVSLTSTSGYCFDLTLPLPPQRFYRAWQTTPPSQPPTLALHLVPAITLTGAIGSSVRLDYINRFGPIDAWVTLDTVTLTNTSQLYFDVSAPGQPERLYRLVPSP